MSSENLPSDVKLIYIFFSVITSIQERVYFSSILTNFTFPYTDEYNSKPVGQSFKIFAKSIFSFIVVYFKLNPPLAQ